MDDFTASGHRPDPRARRPEPSPVIRRPPYYRPPEPPPPRPAPPGYPPQSPPQPAPRPPRPAPSPSRPPGPPAATRKPRKRRPWGRIALTLLIVGVVALAATGVWIDTTMHRVAALTDYPGRPGVGRGTTWLLVGSDSREGLTPEQQSELTTGGDMGNGRTDTILLVHIPALSTGGAATMVSIPRDSYVPIPGYGTEKINSAFSLGGAPLLAQTVEEATGMRLDHYAEIGFGGFAELVDAVGGVTMCLAEPISDPLAGIDLPAGCQRLDGRNALGYVRSRATPRADLDRMAHQREFMSALLHQVLTPAALLNPLRWYPMARAAARTVMVDEQAHIWDLLRLAWALHGHPITTMVPIGEFTGTDVGSVVIWDHDAARRLFAALSADQPAPPDTLNGYAQ